MKKTEAIEKFLGQGRVLTAKFVSHAFKPVTKLDKPIGVVNLFEVQHSDGKAPTVQTWLPKGILTVEQAQAVSPCTFKHGQALVIEFDGMEKDKWATNGVLIRAKSVSALEA